ncbi:MAG TPA: hypothetical protein VFI24_18475 [Pyrinomonadaceae bacterium]|nr:hypothetical protein [Pyrinomonadaceae bacterium]
MKKKKKGVVVCDLNQFFVATGSNYLPQNQSKPLEIAHPNLVCHSSFGTIKLPKVDIGTYALPEVH